MTLISNCIQSERMMDFIMLRIREFVKGEEEEED